MFPSHDVSQSRCFPVTIQPQTNHPLYPQCAKPALAYQALAEFERAGFPLSIATFNTNRLHERCGNQRVWQFASPINPLPKIVKDLLQCRYVAVVGAPSNLYELQQLQTLMVSAKNNGAHLTYMSPDLHNPLGHLVNLQMAGALSDTVPTYLQEVARQLIYRW